MSEETDWEAQLKKTQTISDFDEREARTMRIMSDPAPKWEAPVKKDYPQTELHYIMCYDELDANISMPEAAEKYNSPHKIGGILASDRLNTPKGWFRTPRRGTPIEAIEDVFPAVFEALKAKNVSAF